MWREWVVKSSSSIPFRKACRIGQWRCVKGGSSGYLLWMYFSIACCGVRDVCVWQIPRVRLAAPNHVTHDAPASFHYDP